MNNLESVLERELRPVSAPAELWERIETARNPLNASYPLNAGRSGLQARHALRPAGEALGREAARLMDDSSGLEARPTWSAAAQPGSWKWAMAVAALILVVSASWALRRDYGIQSTDPAQIRAWVMANTGIDVPLSLAAPVQMASVGSIDRGRGAEIAYEIDGQRAILRVAPAEAGQAVAHTRPIIGSRLAKWVLRGQVYTLECASPEGLQTACRLCHG